MTHNKIIKLGVSFIALIGVMTIAGAFTISNGDFLRFMEQSINGQNWIKFTPPASITADRTCLLQDTANPIPDSCVGNGVDEVGGGGGGDVVGPASSVNNNIASFSLTTGKLIQDSGVLVTSVVLGPASVVSANIATFNGTTGKLIQDGGATVASLAPKASPVFTGDPTAPTATIGDNDTSIATTAFVDGKIESLCVAASDETTDLTTGTAKVTWRMPYPFTLVSPFLRASINDAAAGTLLTIDINEGGVSIMTTTKLTIDIAELTSVTAVAQPGVTDTSLADDAEMKVDIDGVGTTAKGLKICLIGHQ